MELWIIALIKIIFINILLSGDNALVIAMASKQLPEKQRKLAMFWGAFGAIALRIILTIVAIQLLKIPYLSFIGGLMLLYIAYQLFKDAQEMHQIKSVPRLGTAIMTIIVADFVMSMDNALAIAAIAERDIILIGIGLLVSIPLIIWGSKLILVLLDRYPIFIDIGAAILAFTAGEIMLNDQAVIKYLPTVIHNSPLIVPIILAAVFFTYGRILKQRTIYSRPINR